VKDGIALVFDATLTTKAALFIALSEVRPKSRFLNTPSKTAENNKA
jgi:hypothetical protein